MAEILIRIPGSYIEEKQYALKALSAFTGSDFVIERGSEDYEFILPGNKKIIFSDIFFRRAEGWDTYIDRSLIPQRTERLTCSYCDDLPLIFGDGSFFENENEIRIEFDIVASVFFMLSRWEESAIEEKDDHGRTVSELCLSVKDGFIKRPVVDEYANFLKKLIRKLDPSISFVEHKPGIFVTCDVDSFEKFLPGRTLKMFAGHIIKRFDPFLFVSDLFRYTAKMLGAKDPYDRFGRINETAGRLGTKPVYFILTSPEGPYNDGWFTRQNRDKAVFSGLCNKGAEIGLHYGYFSLLNEKNIIAEKSELEKKYCITVNKGRAHFLQFDVRSSYGILENSGITHDFTMGYSAHAGFRCGTGREFRPWDFDKRRPYQITERPLVVMDTTLYARNRLNKEDIKKEIGYFIRTSEDAGTDMTVLLHNSSPEYVFSAVEEVLKSKKV